MIEITSSTKITGIMGYPIKHTLSPIMHNRAFSLLNLNYLYAVFPVAPKDLAQAVMALPALKIKGVNVTIPFKQDVLKYLDEITPCARRIGAVNTIVNENGKLIGYNTDGEGFINSLKEVNFETAGKKILLLGAGGACRAVALSLAWAGAKKIIVATRNATKAEKMIKETGLEQEVQTECFFLSSLPSEKIAEADLIVNTTPLGMAPFEDKMPDIPLEGLHSAQYVCDLIYNPLKTVLLRKARLKGCKTVNGIGMLVHQGAKSFYLWTKEKPPIDEMRQAILKYVGNSRKKLP
jgi:shikimate dehydrogenase